MEDGMKFTNRGGIEAGAAPPLKPLLIDTHQLGLLLHCGRTKACELIRTGQVRSVLIGRSRRILLEDAERLVAEAVRAAER